MTTSEILQRLARAVADPVTGTMRLMAREGDPRDLPTWHELHRSKQVPYSENQWPVLLEMWRTLLESGRLLLFLAEDRNRPAASRVLSCCAAIFVTDAFCAEIKRTSSPFVELELVRRYHVQQLPVLNQRQIAEANGGEGLNVMLCFEGSREATLSSAQKLALREKQRDALQLALRGFHLKELLGNPVGEESFQRWRDSGARSRKPSTRSDPRGSTPRGPPFPSARVVGLTRAEAEAHSGSYLSGLFVYDRPRFHFSRAEQRLLQHALVGETSEESAEELGLSAWTVKKRWQSIYDRVRAADAELLPPAIAHGTHSQSRGTERRRRLLNYLRQHPEELRPLGRARHLG
jgi:DNA-binding CsgD family transcriptional regulator